MTKAIAKPEVTDASTTDDDPLALSAKLEDGKLEIRGGKEIQQQLMDNLGSECPHYGALMLGQLLPLLGCKRDDPDTATHAIRCAAELLRGFAPQNQVEAMLAVQAVGAHMASVELTRRSINVTQIPQLEANGNLANKFARTFVAQLEGLAKLRRNGKQIVEHVHVNAGGQAVIAGTVHTGGRNE